MIEEEPQYYACRISDSSNEKYILIDGMDGSFKRFDGFKQLCGQIQSDGIYQVYTTTRLPQGNVRSKLWGKMGMGTDRIEPFVLNGLSLTEKIRLLMHRR